MDDARENSEKKQKRNNTVTETTVRLSEDRKWFLFTKTETTFYPYNYISAVLTSTRKKSEQSEDSKSGMEF